MDIFWHLGLTILLELPIVALFYRKKIGAALLIGLLVNCFSWPVLQIIRELTGDAWIPLLELMVVIIETLGFWILLRSKLSKAFIVSLMANLMSYGLSFFIN